MSPALIEDEEGMTQWMRTSKLRSQGTREPVEDEEFHKVVVFSLPVITSFNW